MLLLKKIQSIVSKQNSYLIIFWIIVFYLTGFAVYYLNYGIAMIRFPYELDVGEGLSLNRAMLLSQGENIYTDINSPPYTVMNYPPLYDYITSLFVRITGPILAVGRIISVLSALFISFFIYKIVSLLERNKLGAVISALMFLTSGWVFTWSVLSRVDMLAIMFAVSGLYIHIKASKGRHRLLAILLLILSVYTKQSMIAVPLAICASYLIHKDYKKFLQFILLFTSISLIPFIWLYYITNGQFWLHIYSYTISKYYFKILIFWLKLFFEIHFIFLIIASVAIVKWLLKKQFTLVSVYFIFAFLISLSVGKIGSSINYLIEFWAACCLVFGLYLSNSLNQFKKGHIYKIETYFIAFAILAQLLLLNLKQDFSFSIPGERDKQSAHMVSHAVSLAKGPVLSEYNGYLVLNKKEVTFQSFSFKQLTLRGLWDQKPLLHDIEDRKFGLIVKSEDRSFLGRWTKEILRAIDKNYYLINRVPSFDSHMGNIFLELWQPKPFQKT